MHRATIVSGLLIGALFALAVPGLAQVQTQTGQPTPTLHGELALSLDDALRMGIENNLRVEVVRHDPMIATENAIAAWGAYDPDLFGDYTYARRKRPVASSLQSGASVNELEKGGQVGIRGLLPKLGWSYEVAYNGKSLESTSSIQGLSPEYTADLTASVTLPLLKGFLWGDPWAQVKTTKILEGSALEEFRTELMDTISSIENTYWELIATQQALRVANKSLETAEALLEQTKAQYEVGVVSRVEVVESEAGVADREFTRVVTENRYLKAQDDLIDLVLGPHLTPDSRLEIHPTTEPDVVDYQVDEEEATRKAFEHRPELFIAQSEVHRQQINLKFAKNQRLPQIDLVGRYGFTGLAGRTNSAPPLGDEPRPPSTVGRRYSQVDDEFFSADGSKNWSAGAQLVIPIGSIAERADVRRAKLELRRARTDVRRTEQIIVLEIRDAVRNLRSSLEGLEAAGERLEAAEEQLRAETIRLEHGESTPFDVLLREEDLVEAEGQRITALQSYRDSVTSLDRRQGTILRDRGIVVDEARTLR